MNDINKKGFTLVELLAVIVILSVIMVIAIPSVITIMGSARQKVFTDYATKVASAAEKKYFADSLNGDISDSCCYLYDITKSIGLENTGDFKGYILVDVSDEEDPNYYISMYNSDFKLLNFDYTKDNKKINEKIETIDEKDTIDNNKIIYELSTISPNCDSVSYNFEDQGYNDTFDYVPDIADPSTAELKASYLKPGREFNTALKMLSGNAVQNCEHDPDQDPDEEPTCGIYEDSSITKISKSSATPPKNAVVVSTDASKYPTYTWVEGSTLYYKSDATIYMNADSSGYFSYFPNVTSIDLSGFNTSTSTNMSYMFAYSSLIASLNLSNFDTSNVINVAGMFESCSSLTSLDLSNFNTTKVTNMESMFEFCSSLTSLNLSSFDTSKVTNMNNMFVYCTSITSLNVSNFNTSSLENFQNTFSNMSKLKNINLSNFDTSKVKFMNGLFSGDSELEELDLSNFNTSSVTYMSSMFSGLKNLKKLNISNFNTSKVTGMAGMFSGCERLDTIIGFERITTENVTDMRSMFSSFQSYVTNGHLDLSNFNTSKVTDMSSMFSSTFAHCNTFTLNLGEHFDTSGVIRMTSMFNMFAYAVPSFTLDLGPNFDTSKAYYMEYMFQSVGRESTDPSTNIIFGDKFVFTKGIKTTKMFAYFLEGISNAVIHFPDMNFSVLGTNRSDMFYNWRSTKTVYVKNASDQYWLRHNFDAFTNDNTFVES